MTIPINALVADFLFTAASHGLVAIGGGPLMHLHLIGRVRLTISSKSLNPTK
jgi:hypothetical protein